MGCLVSFPYGPPTLGVLPNPYFKAFGEDTPSRQGICDAWLSPTEHLTWVWQNMSYRLGCGARVGGDPEFLAYRLNGVKSPVGFLCFIRCPLGQGGCLVSILDVCHAHVCPDKILPKAQLEPNLLHPPCCGWAARKIKCCQLQVQVGGFAFMPKEANYTLSAGNPADWQSLRS